MAAFHRQDTRRSFTLRAPISLLLPATKGLDFMKCMIRRNPWARLLTWTAMLGVLMPVPATNCAEPRLAGGAQPARETIVDATLTQSGSLRGVVYSAQGTPLEGVDVLVMTIDGQGVRSRTTAGGEFAVDGLKGGVYQVVAGHGSQVVRAWAEGTAPPAAERQVLIVSDPNVALGQWEPGTFGYFLQEAKYTLSNPLVVGGIIAAAVAIPVAIHNADDDDEPSGS
jgi:hypothetical protein